MRNAMMQALTKLARNDRNIMLLTADLGFNVFEEFEYEFPDQFLNVGVSEQNMTGVAAGLALEGKKVFTYSIGIFPTLRCLEQIRNDICYHNLNVNIIGMGGGLSYGALGMSHHATEDLGVLRSIPQISILAPCSKNETFVLINETINLPGPSYIRLDKTSIEENNSVTLGKVNLISQGNDVLIIGIGGVLKECNLAREKFLEKGLSTTVLSAHTLKPFDENGFLKHCDGKKAIVSIEEASSFGGLSSAISEVICKYQISTPFKGISLGDIFISTVGDQTFLKEQYGISSENIVNTVNELLNISV